MTTNVIDLATHKKSACERADEVIGLALQLRSALKTEVNLPLPEAPTDDLIRSLAVWLAEARQFPR